MANRYLSLVASRVKRYMRGNPQDVHPLLLSSEYPIFIRLTMYSRV